MRPTRAIATAILLASIAVAGCAGRQSDQPAAPQPGQAAATTTPQGPTPSQPSKSPERPAVLADGRHPVLLTAVDPARRTITFDLIQWYFGEDANREAAKDHKESPVANDIYTRNVNPKLRTLPVKADAPITVNNLLNSHQPIPVSLAKLATLTHEYSPDFWITVSHDQVLKINEQWTP